MSSLDAPVMATLSPVRTWPQWQPLNEKLIGYGGDMRAHAEDQKIIKNNMNISIP